MFLSKEDYNELAHIQVVIAGILKRAVMSNLEEEREQNFSKLFLTTNETILNFNNKENSELKKPKTLRTLKIEGCKVHLRARICGKGISYELRYRKDGLNVNASSTVQSVAIKKFTEKLKIALSTKFVPNIPTNFHDFTMYYFDNFRKKKVAKSTYEGDLNRYKNNLLAPLGTMQISKITPIQCQQVIEKILSEGKEKSAQDVYSLLNGIFKMAIAHGIIERNPLAIVMPVTHEREHGKALSKEEEIFLLEQTAGTPYHLMFAVALYTGLRPNEYATARIEGNFIVAVNSKRKTKRTEYKKIPITPMLRPYLDGVTELKFYTPEVMRDKFKSILSKHKLYDLRTTFYTRCKECGIADVAIMAFVGHSLGKLGNAYTDLSDEFLLKEGNKFIY